MGNMTFIPTSITPPVFYSSYTRFLRISLVAVLIPMEKQQQSKLRFFGTPLKAKMTLENPPCSIQNTSSKWWIFHNIISSFRWVTVSFLHFFGLFDRFFSVKASGQDHGRIAHGVGLGSSCGETTAWGNMSQKWRLGNFRDCFFFFWS